MTVSQEKYRNKQTDRVKSNEDTNDNKTDEIVKFNKDKTTKVYGKDRNNKEIQKRLMKIQMMIHTKE